MPPFKYNSINALEENSLNVYLESTEILIRIARNILKDPTNPKFRLVSQKNKIIKTKLLSAIGGMQCLLDMGFQEDNEDLILSQQMPLDSIKYIYNELLKKREEKTLKLTPVTAENSKNCPSDNKTLKIACELKMLQNELKSPFLKKAVFWCYCVLKYNNFKLLKKAVNMIPLIKLNLNVMKCIRNIQLEYKKKNINDEVIDCQELLLRELCHWFNEEFFTWVDTPSCKTCGFIETMYEGMSYEIVPGADRVEKYRCQKCKSQILFPRYNDPEKLLETKRGRCGEWANCFCLFCYALGWDSRLIFDETDHVWVEVWSVVKSKWLHCDPCEDAVDTPLMYECGWKKKLSYIIAYSFDDIQDVTWRYSQNHMGILKNRKKCSENELIDFILKVRSILLKNASVARKNFVSKRTALELVELMKENSPKELEEKGRISGSISWRLLRGETTEANFNFKPYIWRLNDVLEGEKKFELSYITSKDIYVKNCKTVMTNWINGVYQSKCVFKNNEKDWKMTYLARKEGAVKGLVSWKFEAEDKLFIETISLKLICQTYESGVVSCTLRSENLCITIPSNNKQFTTHAFTGSKSVELIVELYGGHFWQHAQILRQSFTSEEPTFQIVINLGEK